MRGGGLSTSIISPLFRLSTLELVSPFLRRMPKTKKIIFQTCLNLSLPLFATFSSSGKSPRLSSKGSHQVRNNLNLNFTESSSKLFHQSRRLDWYFKITARTEFEIWPKARDGKFRSCKQVSSLTFIASVGCRP